MIAFRPDISINGGGRYCAVCRVEFNQKAGVSEFGPSWPKVRHGTVGSLGFRQDKVLEAFGSLHIRVNPGLQTRGAATLKRFWDSDGPPLAVFLVAPAACLGYN
jgi:hypothetical protein